MRIDFLREPELEFGAGNHIDIRFGLMNYGPFDIGSALRPKEILVGLVGTPTTTEGIRRWLEQCRDEIPAKVSNQPNLFPRFPGFNDDSVFECHLTLDSSLERTVSDRTLNELSEQSKPNAFIEAAVDSFLNELSYLVENTAADVLICAVPEQIAAMRDPDVRRAAGARPDEAAVDFHDMLKAKAMSLGKPLQLVLPETYDPSVKRKQKVRSWRARTLQDVATRAWNFHTALYYKAGGLPWRVPRDPAKYTTCFVGVGFYRSLDRETVMTSMAQVFDERGDGMVIRGGPVDLAKDDKTPHLSSEDAETLLTEALTRYREVHGTAPARVVVHKTSLHNEAEVSGFRSALDAERIRKGDLTSLVSGAEARLFRSGNYPPLRGTFLQLEPSTFMLYTRGSVDFFRTYPGMYVPRPLVVRCDDVDSTSQDLAAEILMLTKMNWNLTQFDSRRPITLEAAVRVGKILRYAEAMSIAPHYRFYM